MYITYGRLRLDLLWLFGPNMEYYTAEEQTHPSQHASYHLRCRKEIEQNCEKHVTIRKLSIDL